MSKATAVITDKFKKSRIRVANVSESVAVQKMMFKLGFKTFNVNNREVSNDSDIRIIYVNIYCQMYLYTEEAKGNQWRDITVAELRAAVEEVRKIKRQEGKEQKKRKAARKAAEGWTAWNSGKNFVWNYGSRGWTGPVEEGTIIDIKFRDGKTEYSVAAGSGRARGAFWYTEGVDRDIVAYRIVPVKPKEEPAKPVTVTLEQMMEDVAGSMGKGLAVPVASLYSIGGPVGTLTTGSVTIRDREGDVILDSAGNVVATGFYISQDGLKVGDPQPDTNPKKQYGLASVPLNMWSPLASAYGALGLYNGSLKYGSANFANTKVEASIYIAAAMRHLSAWASGQEDDPADGVPNLGGVLANIAILLEARAAGTLIDDRLLMSGYLKEIDMLKGKVKHLQALHADKNPKHYIREGE